MSEEENYNLKESAEGIGQLYPVLVDKKGRIIDGFHRLQADSKWRVQPLDNIDTDEKLLIARCVANWHRRPVGREEKAEWINGLAKLYKEQGLSSDALRTHKNEIKEKLIEVLGLSESTISDYLDSQYKSVGGSPIESRLPRIPASERVKSQLGPEVVERFRKEVLEEAKLSPEELTEKRKKDEELKAERKRKAEENKQLKEAELEKKIEKKIVVHHQEEVKEELLASPEFREEVFKRDLKERYEKATEEHGKQIWDVQKIDEAQDVLDEIIKANSIIQGLGVNHYAILKKFNRLEDAYEIVDMMQNKLQEWRMTQYV